MTEFNDYQDETLKTAVYPEAGDGTVEAVTYTVLGLTSEAGEVASLMKRVYRDHDGEINADTIEKFKKELGDVLWYVSRCAEELDLALDDIAVTNLERLAQRKAHGTLKGEGDDR